MCTESAMDWAAKNGHLEMVKWLHENRDEGFTTWAMDWAILFRHISIIKWLTKNKKESYTNNVIDSAVDTRDLEIIEWIDKNTFQECNKTNCCYRTGCTRRVKDFIFCL